MMVEDDSEEVTVKIIGLESDEDASEADEIPSDDDDELYDDDDDDDDDDEISDDEPDSEIEE
jgi:hypothetical protein